MRVNTFSFVYDRHLTLSIDIIARIWIRKYEKLDDEMKGHAYGEVYPFEIHFRISK